MLEMAMNLQQARTLHTQEDKKQDKILFYGLSKMMENLGEAP